MSHVWACGSWAVLAAALGLVGCSDDPPAGAAAPHATGALDPWATLAPMPVPRANHCAVAANGFLVVIGGNYKPKGAMDFVTVADVHVARIAADGSIGEWKLAGKTPSPVASCTAASDGKDVYLVDGIFDAEAAGGMVRRAALTDAGDLGPWEDVGALPGKARVLFSQAFVAGGVLKAFHSHLQTEGDDVALLSAPIAGAALGPWADSVWLPGFRGQPQYALATVGEQSYAYVLGGYATGNGMLADGAGAPLDAAGAPGKSFPTSAMPKAVGFGKAIAVDDFVFVVGGKDEIFAGAGSSNVFAAKIGAGGALDAWTTLAPLPEGRTSHSVVSYGDFLYVVGGGFKAGGLDTVFSARVRFLPAAAP